MNEPHPPRVVLYEPAGRGGVCHYTYELAQGLSGAGADVTLMTTEDWELAALERRFRVERLFTRSWPRRILDRFRRRDRASRRTPAPAPPAAASRASRPAGRKPLLRRLRLRWIHGRTIARLRRQGADVVHVQWLADRSADLEFMRRLRRSGIPVVYTAHDVEPHLTASDQDRAQLRLIYEAASRVIVHTHSNRRELLTVFGLEPSKVSVIPHGAYDMLCVGERRSREEARDRIGIPRDRPVVLFFGLIKRYKGLEYLVEAFEAIRRRSVDAVLLIVGEIFAGDAEGHRFYRGLVDRLAGRADVRCVPEYVPIEEVGTYLAAADVVVLPYVRTYHSGVLLAAYAAARPVIVTNTGGLAETVEPGKSGLVVAPADAGALEGALAEMVRDPGRMRAMGERAKELAEHVYAWDAIASRTLELYRSAGSAQGSPEKKGERGRL